MEYDDMEINLDKTFSQDPEERKRAEDILAEVEYLSSDSYYKENVEAQAFDSPMISTKFLEQREQKMEKKKKKKDLVGESDWFSDLMGDIAEAEAGTRIKTKHKVSLEDMLGVKKKKKKKKKKGEPTDFRREFETENSLYNNILRDTTRFVDSLQREYDSLAAKKGSGRGTTKNVQDLISNITSARQLAANLVDKKVSLKKLSYELAMKERKELGIGNEDNGDVGVHGSAYLKQLIESRDMLFRGGSDVVSDIDSDDVESYLDESIARPVTDAERDMYGDSDRTEEADLYLKYENSNISVFVVLPEGGGTSDAYYIARDEDGDEVDDYPLPVSRISSINRSTGIATDEFGQKYQIEWTAREED